MPVVTRTGTSTQPLEAGGSAEAGASQDQAQGQTPPPPPPPSMDMAQLLQAFREERQANTAALQMIAQAVTNNRQEAGNGNGRSTLVEFKKHAPPTFIETAEPLDADDWVRTIEDLLELVSCTEDREKVAYAAHCLGGTAKAWWDGFKAMRVEQNITWNDFKAEFRKAHIPSGSLPSRSVSSEP